MDIVPNGAMRYNKGDQRKNGITGNFYIEVLYMVFHFWKNQPHPVLIWVSEGNPMFSHAIMRHWVAEHLPTSSKYRSREVMQFVSRPKGT